MPRPARRRLLPLALLLLGGCGLKGPLYLPPPRPQPRPAPPRAASAARPVHAAPRR